MRKKLPTEDLDAIISDGSALAGGGLVTAAIEADRLRTGRQTASLQASKEVTMPANLQTGLVPPTAGHDEANQQAGQVASLQASHATAQHATLQTSQTASFQANSDVAQPESMPSSKTVNLQAIPTPAPQGPEPTITVTVRIPISLNDRMAAYVYQHRREKVTKQALTIEALQTYLGSAESTDAG